MNQHRRSRGEATRSTTFVLVGLAITWLAPGGVGCTALIDGELSGKAGGAAGAADSAGGGGAAGDTGAAGNPTQTTTQQTTTQQTTTQQTTTTQTVTNPCPQGCTLAHATAACEAGGCVIVDCEPHFADCDQTDQDGCEADLQNDSQHCGKCSRVCDSNEGEVCKDGKCK
jgi:hypothetical protein